MLPKDIDILLYLCYNSNMSMDSSPSDYQASYNYSVNPFEISLPPSERKHIASAAKHEIDRAITSRTLNFSEQISSRSHVELNANPQLPPSWEFGALMQTAYDRADVTMQREFVDGEYRFVNGTVFLYGSTIPLAYAATLHILADEQTTKTAIDLDSPDFYLEVPDLESGQSDIIPLDYARLKVILDGLVAQSDMYEAITNDNRSIEESLLAILEMSNDRSVKREARYKFNDLASIGHAVVAIVQQYHYAAGVAEPIDHHHSVAVDNLLYLNDDGSSTATTTYKLEDQSGKISTQTGVAYERMFVDDQLAESFKQEVHRSAQKWRRNVSAESHKKARKTAKKTKFGSYIAMGLSRINNVSSDPTSKQLQ